MRRMRRMGGKNEDATLDEDTQPVARAGAAGNTARPDGAVGPIGDTAAGNLGAAAHLFALLSGWDVGGKD
eukprot:4402135-Pyramimonas_sp.AAC.1